MDDFERIQLSQTQPYFFYFLFFILDLINHMIIELCDVNIINGVLNCRECYIGERDTERESYIELYR